MTVTRELPPIEIPGPHEPRKIRFLGYHVVDGWVLKLYGVAAHGDVPRAALVDAMRREADARLPRPATAELRHGVGFAIAHDAADLGFVLIDWWYGHNEIHQIVLSTALEDPSRLAPHPLPRSRTTPGRSGRGRPGRRPRAPSGCRRKSSSGCPGRSA